MNPLVVSITQPSLRYTTAKVVFQEVPDEVSLAIEISGCLNRCPGCHSPELQDPLAGQPLAQDFLKLLAPALPYISCVCFMGGEHNPQELVVYMEFVKKLGLKVALYSGLDDAQQLHDDLWDPLKYLKIGSYNETLGGLTSLITNQQMVEFPDESTGWLFRDITWKFRRNL